VATREAERATNPTQKRKASAAKNLQNREEDNTNRGEEGISSADAIREREKGGQRRPSAPLKAAGFVLARFGGEDRGEERLHHVQGHHEGERA
jgi:septal ring factor EnvC (AmiA/AmiB activator)